MSFELRGLPMVTSPHVPTRTRFLSPYVGLAALRYHQDESRKTQLQRWILLLGVVVGALSFSAGGVWRVVGGTIALGAAFIYFNRVQGYRKAASVLLKLEKERVVRGLDQVLAPQAANILEPVCEQWLLIEHVLASRSWEREPKVSNDVRLAVEHAVDGLVVRTLAESEAIVDDARSVTAWGTDLRSCLSEIVKRLQKIQQTLDAYERPSGESAGAPLDDSQEDVADLYDWLAAIV